MVEVLKKLGRSAKQLKLLGFYLDEASCLNVSALVNSFLRSQAFENLRQVDVYQHHKIVRNDYSISTPTEIMNFLYAISHKRSGLPGAVHKSL